LANAYIALIYYKDFRLSEIFNLVSDLHPEVRFTMYLAKEVALYALAYSLVFPTPSVQVHHHNNYDPNQKDNANGDGPNRQEKGPFQRNQLYELTSYPVCDTIPAVLNVLCGDSGR
jgi:hypothetical protein